MTIFVPVFENGYRKAEAINTEKARYYKTPGYDANIIYCGMIYNGENIFSDEKGVDAYWRRDFNTMNKYRIEYPNK